MIAEHERRVRAVREAVGAEVDLHVDANCSLDGFHAARLARLLEPPVDGFLEAPARPGLGFEPIAQNVRELAKRPTSRGKGKA